MPDEHGPYRSFRFLLEIGGVAKAGFNVCYGASSSTSVVEYREGNEAPAMRKLAGLNEFSPLVLESGATNDSIELFEWRRLVADGKLEDARRDVAVVLLDREGNPAARWEFVRAWPSRYEMPALDAERSAVAIETLEIVFEDFRRVGAGGETDGGGGSESREQSAESDRDGAENSKPPKKPGKPGKPSKRQG